MDSQQVKRELRKVMDPHEGPRSTQQAAEAALELIEQQETLLVTLSGMWGSQPCWAGHPEPCGECKACMTTKLLIEAGIIWLPQDGPTLFDL